MAHPMVEKLQDFGIKHGEKIGVAVVSAAALVMIWTALNQPSTSHTVEEITKANQQAEQNLRNPQKEDDVRVKIHEEGIKQPEFEKVVDNRKPGTADPSKYQLVNVLEAPEPGAGLLRERPELLTVAKLQAHSGRGAIRLLEVDETTGQFVPRPAKTDEPKQAKKKRRRNNRNTAMGRMMGGMGQAGGGMGRMMGENMGGANKKDDPAAKKRAAEQDRRFNKQIAGDVDPNAGKQGEPDNAQQDNAPAQNEDLLDKLHGFRWAVLTGVVDNKQLRDNYARALKLDPSGAYVHYLRVDLQRRALQDDGTWSNWEMVDRKYTTDILSTRLTDVEAETSPDNLPILDEKAKLEALCDPLPFLEAGYWSGVYHADAINPAVLKKKDATKKSAGGAGGGAGGAGMGGGAMDEMALMGGRGGRGSSSSGRMPGSNMVAGGMGSMGGMMAGGAAGGEGGAGAGQYGMMFGGGSGGAGAEEDKNFPKAEADKLPVRAFDFTVDPDTTYQYRVRLVVHNPNYRVDNVMPGVDSTSKELSSDWSEPSPIVSIPPDVQTYVRGPSVEDIRVNKPGALTFGVVRWNSTDGLTVVQTFQQGIGEILGDETSATIPVEDEKGETKKRSRLINFTSDRILVDSSGGPLQAERLQLGAPIVNLPASALLLRADGRIEMRDEASESVKGELAEMMAIYNRSLKDAELGEKKTSNSFGGMMGGMGGGMLGSQGAN